MKFIWYILLACTLLSCRPDKDKSPKSGLPRASNQNTAGQHQKIASTPIHHRLMEFVEYNDDGDYFLVTVKKSDSLFTFINESEDRSLLKGDVVNIAWEPTLLSIAGDEDRQLKTDKIISMLKVKDGKVSEFRQRYQKKLKYTWPANENYSQAYLDKLYLLVEYYIANSKSELLQHAINNGEQITYSVEEQRRNGKDYILIGIATTTEHHINTIQWLYLEKVENVLYEYDLSNDELVRFE